MMKLLNKLAAAAVLLFASNTATAGLIVQQDILSESAGQIGYISYDLNSAVDDGFGFLEIDSWYQFSFFGFELDPAASFLFVGTIDSFDVEYGLVDLVFDINDDFAIDPFAFNGSIGDLLNPDGGFLDVFYPANDQILAFYDDLSFGELTYVSEPTTVALFLVVVAGMLVRARRA